MFDRIKGIGDQLASMAGDAVDGVTSTVRDGATSIADAAGSAASSLNEKAIRTAISQMRTVLEIAAEDLRKRPVLNRPVTLTTTVDIGFTALEMQIVMDPADDPPRIALDVPAPPAIEPGSTPDKP